MIPDVLIMSEKVWGSHQPEDQEIILEAARFHRRPQGHVGHRCGGGRQGGQETMGVEFVYDVDKEAFREATQPMIEAYEEEYPASRR